MTDVCELHKVHNPTVSRCVLIAVLPAFLEARLREANPSVRIKRAYTRPSVAVCPTGAANIEEYTRYLLGERGPLTVRVGSETKSAAQAGVLAYEAAVMGSKK